MAKKLLMAVAVVWLALSGSRDAIALHECPPGPIPADGPALARAVAALTAADRAALQLESIVWVPGCTNGFGTTFPDHVKAVGWFGGPLPLQVDKLTSRYTVRISSSYNRAGLYEAPPGTADHRHFWDELTAHLLNTGKLAAVVDSRDLTFFFSPGLLRLFLGHTPDEGEREQSDRFLESVGVIDNLLDALGLHPVIHTYAYGYSGGGAIVNMAVQGRSKVFRGLIMEAGHYQYSNRYKIWQQRCTTPATYADDPRLSVPHSPQGFFCPLNPTLVTLWNDHSYFSPQAIESALGFSFGPIFTEALAYDLGARPQAVRDRHRSYLVASGNIHTKTFHLYGMQDPQVPLQQGIDYALAVRGAKSQGKFRMYAAPNYGHGFEWASFAFVLQMLEDWVVHDMNPGTWSTALGNVPNHVQAGYTDDPQCYMLEQLLGDLPECVPGQKNKK